MTQHKLVHQEKQSGLQTDTVLFSPPDIITYKSEDFFLFHRLLSLSVTNVCSFSASFTHEHKIYPLTNTQSLSSNSALNINPFIILFFFYLIVARDSHQNKLISFPTKQALYGTNVLVPGGLCRDLDFVCSLLCFVPRSVCSLSSEVLCRGWACPSWMAGAPAALTPAAIHQCQLKHSGFISARCQTVFCSSSWYVASLRICVTLVYS